MSPFPPPPLFLLRVPVYATMNITEVGDIVSWLVSPFVATRLKWIK